MVLGHEAFGEVIEVGPSTQRVRPGDKVVMSFLPQCGECDACARPGGAPCEKGSASNTSGELLGGGRRLSWEGTELNHHLGVSAFADYAVVSEKSLVVVDDDIPPTVGAVLGCAVLTGAGAVFNVAKPEPGDSVTVVGLGGVGMAAVLAALFLDGVGVVAVDLSADRLEFARALGASLCYTPDEALEAGHRSSIVIEAAGSIPAFETALALTGAAGVTVTVGLPNPRDRASVSVVDLVASNRTIKGSYMGGSQPLVDIPRYIDAWRTGRFPIEKLASSELALDEVNFGMDQLADAIGIRQVIRP